ncbi:enoyl-CoA hydratase/isomerase family protein [Pantoea sp. 18069]|uniref:enoyl-CoA hydratase/isomerase family protein n=1 Tax=Pantoea sp. 18069 TaxID=2681415 RepID=UPI00190F1F4E|nr:enoyl-CoA hydratase-related protein [Pantoea sp. 18069]
MNSMPPDSPPCEEALRIERDGAIVTLVFNRPQALNAINVAMAQALLAALQDIAQDDSVRALVLRGEGRAFMAGGDLLTLQRDPLAGVDALLAPLNQALLLLAKLNAPVIAQVQGAAAGAGLSLMLQADFVLAAEGAQFNLAYINLGASCDVGASWALPRWVGLRRALEIAMLGEALDASQALQMGLINRIVPAAELPDEVQRLAARLAQGPTQALGHMRRLMRASLETDLQAQLQAEWQAFRACAQTHDLRAGIDAFFQKQPARFTGR